MLRIENLSKTYANKVKAVDDISFHIEPKDMFGFIGHNGAGKTTTLKCVAGILEFEKGEIYINGKSIKEDPVGCKADIAYVPDNPDVYESLTGIQYLNFVADIFKVSKHDRERLTEYYAEQLTFTHALGDIISSYSHGMKQKLVIISALIHSPKLLIFDEPFTGLDPQASFTVKEIMKDICNKGGAVFFSTHVLDVAEKICNKIAIIKNGKIAALGDIQSVMGDKSLESTFMELAKNE
ncbi:MAG TPA: ABC transporter ATP-binding protein [Clostridia bacterium]|jgi:ABC-2 type transport system ATP-binding protein|nr:MAG: ABC-type transporter ATP-binding protein EcsA [Firmicutes bacterium ADurb.Bin099]HHT95990.1 ABC transporter ATP-binding protein [Clostridiaceae bacterium]HNZ40591.1 ABC transporter ATP-binding protein [Clostridia bacterium]HOF27157.1 ABC transporter ATP-binding protein [Clostridia bacterium]HOM34835.1 ABC transporter ATP-binding protein [Clostridia bacterium]